MKKETLIRLFVVLTCTMSMTAWSQLALPTPVASASTGHMGLALPASEVVLDSLPQAQPGSGQPLRYHDVMDGLTEQQREARRQSAAFGTTGASRGTFEPASSTTAGDSVSALKSFAGAGENGSTPSDMALAVGPTYVLQAVNDSILITDKNGVIQSGYPKTAQSFFGLASTTYVTDPRAFYDWGNARFVVIMLEETLAASGNQGYLLLAVSKTNDPRGAWYNYGATFQIGATGECPDYPTLGNDHTPWIGSAKGGIYIGINQFSNCSSSGSFIQNYMFLLPKTSLYTGAGYSYWAQYGFNVGGTLVDTIQPMNVTAASHNPAAEFMVNSYNLKFGGGQCSTGCNGLVVWAISNPFGFISGGPGPEITGTTLGTTHTYKLSTGGDEPGCNNCIETLDTRISGSVQYSAGSIFGSLETQDPNFQTGENSPIWFEVHPVLGASDARCVGTYANACPVIASAALRQEDCFVCGGWASHGSAFFGTLQPDPENNLVMVYNYTSQSSYPGTAYTSRRVSYGDGLMNGAGIYLANGAAYYNQGRWGDYTATAVDLNSSLNPYMWFSGMYSDANGNWATQIGKAGYTAPNQE